jgi:hypothetical protein
VRKVLEDVDAVIWFESGVVAGVADATGIDFSCKSFNLIVGCEKVNPFIETLIQPFFSTKEVVTILFVPSELVTSTAAFIGAPEKPYKHRANSLFKTKS